VSEWTTKATLSAETARSFAAQGYLLVWGADPDCQGETFIKGADPVERYWLGRLRGAPTLFHHGLHLDVGPEPIGEVDDFSVDTTGLFIRAKIDRAGKWAVPILKALKEGLLGWSSGSVSHLVEKSATGQITRWPIAEASLTSTPCAGADTTAEYSAKRELAAMRADFEAFQRRTAHIVDPRRAELLAIRADFLRSAR
jgi:hypothetical protein